jgi:hypothetical protein
MEERTVAPVMVNRSAFEELYSFDFESKSQEDLVRSLKVSLAGVFLDTFRAHTRPEELQQGDNMVGCQLWERIQDLFPDVREQRLAFLLFHCNLSPSDILRYAPQEFRDKQEIYQFRRDMLDRILQHSDLTH